MPTVLDLLHVPAPPMDGVSLVALMTGRVKHLDLDAYSESAYSRRFGWSELHALRAGRYKFINAPRPELYDLETDPDEQRNIIHERAALGSVMAARVDALAESVDPRKPMDSSVGAEAAFRLAALGYVGHGVLRAAGAGTEEARPVDPKDCIGRYNEIVRRQSGGAPHLGVAPANAASLDCGGVVFPAMPKNAESGRRALPR
jgi:hypothetical protein